ncbi:MAG TPA: thiolase family protein [Marinagarivorans sp.]
MNAVVIVGVARTPMGAMQGQYASLSAVDLGAQAIRGALLDAGLEGQSVDEVLMGCVLPAGLGQAPARQAALKAGLPSTVCATTINKVCGSGMKTVMQGADAIRAGSAAIVLAGGMESMSNAPHLLAKARAGYRLGHGELLDHMFTEGLQDAYSGELMGIYAEATAAQYGFSRAAQDAFACESLRRAKAACDNGFFKREITEVTVAQRKGTVTVGDDEPIKMARPDKIPLLRPAFKNGGTVTAANASSIADGAAALVLMSRREALSRGVKPLAKIVAASQHAQEPEWFTTAPVGAMRKLLTKMGWQVSDVDLFEINEAFAVVTLAAMQDLALDAAKVNIHGGACALGHPLGASGARILVALIAALQHTQQKRGVASLCIGGGEATAMAVELL